MPLADDHKEQGGYRLLIERSFKPVVESQRNVIKNGGLAVLYDKNPMEASGYAAVIADVFQEPVYYVPCYQDDKNLPVEFRDGVMFVRDEAGEWQPIRAAFRYVTQRPWNRLPIHTKTKIFNPTLACLAGGRNKMVAAKAYDIFNTELRNAGLKILTPETIWDVRKHEIPLWVQKMGGQAVVKIPYSNAGQGVFTIVNKTELDKFMAQSFPYERFIVQSLLGNYQWSSETTEGRLYHVGTVPNSKGETYVADLRMMVSATSEGIKPLCVYARKSKEPLLDELHEGSDSWDMLGTNLSIKHEDGTWGSDTNRLVLMDRRDFNKLGLGLDDLIEGYIQTILSMIAIDKMAVELMNSKGRFRTKLFRALNDDDALLNEILM
jgi:hypothetical protein